jgi:hypothetical protein
MVIKGDIRGRIYVGGFAKDGFSLRKTCRLHQDDRVQTECAEMSWLNPEHFFEVTLGFIVAAGLKRSNSPGEQARI